MSTLGFDLTQVTAKKKKKSCNHTEAWSQGLSESAPEVHYEPESSTDASSLFNMDLHSRSLTFTHLQGPHLKTMLPSARMPFRLYQRPSPSKTRWCRNPGRLLQDSGRPGLYVQKANLGERSEQ